MSQIEYGFDQAAKKFVPGYGMDFPPPSMIRNWAQEIPPESPEKEILRRPLKPADWEPDAAAQFIAEMREKIQAGAFQMPSYQEEAETLAGLRNRGGRPSEIPADLDERQRWARQKAKETGWL